MDIDDTGLAQKAHFFHGFIWEFCVFAIKKTNFEDDFREDHLCNDAECDICPDDTCVTDCEYNEYPAQNADGVWECAPCLPECEDGCVRGTDCNPCLDNLCKVCNDYDNCETCTDHASGNPCSCDPGFFDQGPNCIACDPKCLTCDSTDNSSCTECADGSFLQFESTICLNRCPTGFNALDDSNACSGPVQTVFCIHYDNPSTDDFVDSISGLPIYGGSEAGDEAVDNAPTSAYQRGLYFDGNDYQTIDGIMLNYEFNIQAWFRNYDSAGTIFAISIEDAATEIAAFFFELKLVDNNAMEATYKQNQAISNATSDADLVTPFTWGNYQATLTHNFETSENTFTFLVSGLSHSQVVLAGDPFIDLPSYHHTIGATMTYSSTGTHNLSPSNFYEGLIYGLCISADPDQIFPSGVKDDCPVEFAPLAELQPTDPEYCLIDCNHNQFQENGVCEDCQAHCPYGICVRSENCNLCQDEECDVCDGFTGGCVTCIEDATGAPDADCECIEGTEYDAENHRCRSECEDNCLTCSGPTWQECIECEPGYYKYPETDFCWSSCPTGSVTDEENATCSEVEDLGVFCLTFNDMIQYDWTDQINSIPVIGGLNAGVEDGDEPVPIKGRGIWFDGENDCLHVTGLALAQTHTFSSWNRIIAFGTLVSIFRPNIINTRFVEFQGQPSFTGAQNAQPAELTVRDQKFGGEYVNALGGADDTSFKYVDGNWHLTSYTIVYEVADNTNANIIAESTTARLYLDNDPAGTQSTTANPSIFADGPDTYKVFGASGTWTPADTIEHSNYMAGFVYDLKFFSYAKTAFKDEMVINFAWEDSSVPNPCDRNAFCGSNKNGACPSLNTCADLDTKSDTQSGCILNETGGGGTIEACEAVCLSLCEYDQFYDEVTGECNDCKDTCEDGCVRGENCNPCFDDTCGECTSFGDTTVSNPDDVCESCIDGASPDANGKCQCDGFTNYNEDLNECETCHERCIECYGDHRWYDDCISCSSGFYLQPRSTVCLPTCPATFIPNDTTNTCDPGNTPEIFCQEFDTQATSYNVLAGIDDNASIEPLANDGSTTVIAVFERGLYFDGTSIMVLDNFNLPVNFTLTMFILTFSNVSTGYQTLFATQTSAEPEHLTFKIITGSLQTDIYRDTVIDGTVTSTTGIVTDTWHHVAFCIELDTSTRRSTITQYIDGAAAGTAETSRPFYFEQPELATLGIDSDSLGAFFEGFDGYIYKFCVYEVCKNDFTDEIDEDPQCDNTETYCTTCPEGVCISTCEAEQFNDNDADTCETCDPDCDTCVRVENCHPCLDPECDAGSCPEFDDCTQCIENASDDGLEPFDCKCNEGFFFDIDVTECKSCDPACLECENANPDTCTECREGFYKLKNANYCVPDCPSGYTENDALRLCEGDPQNLGCITFETQELDFSNNFFEIQSGANKGEVAESDDPSSIYKMGKHFDGTTFMVSFDMHLNHSWTIEMWINTSAATGTLFSIDNEFRDVLVSGDEDILNINIRDTSLETYYKKDAFSMTY